jgi:hypothetical protein
MSTEKGGWIITGEGAVQPDQQQRGMHLKIGGESMQSIAVLHVGRDHLHVQRITLRVDQQHALPAIDGRAIDPVRDRVGGSLAAPPLPHQRAYGSVHGGSPDQAAHGTKEGRPSTANAALDRAMLRAGLAAIRQGPWALAAVCAASRRGTSLLNSCRNRFHPFRHWIQATARSRRLIHRSSPCNTDGVWQKPKYPAQPVR